jgi:hypothetical protein
MEEAAHVLIAAKRQRLPELNAQSHANETVQVAQSEASGE